MKHCLHSTTICSVPAPNAQNDVLRVDDILKAKEGLAPMLAYFILRATRKEHSIPDLCCVSMDELENIAQVE